jgi:hypothetical protein
MTCWLPTPLHWTEESEEKAVCALALLQREPQSLAIRPIEWMAPIGTAGALWLQLWRWLGRAGR